MQDDLKKGLLNKKGTGFQKLYEDCLIRIQRIKQKNDVIQKRLGTEDEDDIKDQIQEQKTYLERQINELKKIMEQIESKYRDPESKTKLKQIKNDAEKQIQRNKVILKDFINKSFARKSRGNQGDDENQNNQYLEGGKANYGPNGSNSKSQQNSLLTDEPEQNMVVIDYQMQRKILIEKSNMLNDVEQSTNKINEIMNDMALLTQQQGGKLDIITDQMVKTTQNLVQTNQNLQEASTYQKKSKKKYICLVVLIIFIVIGAGGALYILLG